MDGLELALRCSNLLLRTMNKQSATGAGIHGETSTTSTVTALNASDLSADVDFTDAVGPDEMNKRQLSDTEAERHFAEEGTVFN